MSDYIDGGWEPNTIIELEPNHIFYVGNKNRKEICVFVHKVSHKADLFQFNHKLNKDASRRRHSVDIW